MAAVLAPPSGRYRTRGRHRKPPSHQQLLLRRCLVGGGVTALLAGALVLAGLVVTLPIKAAGPMTGPRPAPSATAAPPRTLPEPPSRTATASDIRGFTQGGPRCDPAQTALAIGRTPRSLVVICSAAAGRFEYLGVRLSDSAMLRTTAERTAVRSFVGRNDGARYAVSPTELLVTAGSTVIKREPMVEFVRAGAAQTPAPR